jgi:hypothetical protein
MGEFGRYTTSEHGAHLFKIITVKENNSKLPWYIIDGSIMSSFPDSWAAGETRPAGEFCGAGPRLRATGRATGQLALGRAVCDTSTGDLTGDLPASV